MARFKSPPVHPDHAAPFPPAPHPVGWGPVLWAAWKHVPPAEIVNESLRRMGYVPTDEGDRLEAAGEFLRLALALTLGTPTESDMVDIDLGRKPLVDHANIRAAEQDAADALDSSVSEDT